MKYDWKVHEKEWYGVKQKPRIVHVPRRMFLCIQEKGNPNDQLFSMQVSALFSLAYAIKMDYKKTHKQWEVFEINDYRVFPLEGIWGLSNNEFSKDHFIYTLMIAQPIWITKEMVESARNKVMTKNSNPHLSFIEFREIEEGDCVEMLHIGSFDDEAKTFSLMNAFIEENGWKRVSDTHKEIYLNNIHRVKTERMKTILRFQIKK